MADAIASTTVSTPTPTSFIALTTIFSAPEGCRSSWTYEPSSYNANPSGLFIQNAVASFDSDCWPPGFTHNGRAEILGTVQVFSPGYCPAGYTTALVAPGDTTTATCCSSGFKYTVSSATAGERAGGGLAGCISTFSSDETTTVLARPDVTLDNDPNFDIVTSTLVGANLGRVTMWAQPLTIAFQQNDLSLFSTSSSAASSAAATAKESSTGATVTGRPIASVAPSTPTESSGLSTGAKAGIGAGVALGALALLGFAMFFLLRRRKRQQQQAPYESAAYEISRPQEMDGESPRVEMSHAPDPTAKVAPGKVHELAGSTSHYR